MSATEDKGFQILPGFRVKNPLAVLTPVTKPTASTASVVPDPIRRITFGRISGPFCDFDFIREKVEEVDEELPEPKYNPKLGRLVTTKTVLVTKKVVHKGIDIGGGDGKSYPVYSPVTGEVVWSQESDTFWPYVVTIKVDDTHYHRFAHLQPQGAVQASSGGVKRYITAGALIGYTSSSEDNGKFAMRKWGRDPGMHAHLHYEITTTLAGAPKTWTAFKRHPQCHYYDPLYFLVTGKYPPLLYKKAIDRAPLMNAKGEIWIG